MGTHRGKAATESARVRTLLRTRMFARRGLTESSNHGNGWPTVCQALIASTSVRRFSRVGMRVVSKHRGHVFARNMGLPPYQRRAPCSAFFIVPPAFMGWSGAGLGVVWGQSGGGPMWIAQGSDIQRLTKLSMWFWVRLSARCIDGEAPANARRVPDVDCVRYWNRMIYVISAGGR